MCWRVSFRALGLLLCLSSPVGGENDDEYNAKISVSISGKMATVTCPSDESKWEKVSGPVLTNSSIMVLREEDEIKGHYRCKATTGEIVREIYLKVKVCVDCVELSFGLVVGLIFSDLLITLGVLLLVYYCSKKHMARFGGGAVGGDPQGRPRSGQKADRPPPVPNPDYEPIRKGQREVYAGLEPRAF